MSLSNVTPRVHRPSSAPARLMDTQDKDRGDSIGTHKVMVSFRLSEDVVRDLGVRSAEMGVSKTAYLTFALKSFFGREIPSTSQASEGVS